MMIGILELCWIGRRMFYYVEYSMQLTASFWDLTSFDSIMVFLFKIVDNNNDLSSTRDTGSALHNCALINHH